MDLGRQPLFLFLLIAVTAIGPLSMQIFVPALPAIQRDFGVTVATAQLAFSISLFAIAFGTLASGPFADRYGRRPVVLVGLGLFLAGTVACLFAPSIWALILGRIVQSAGGAAGMTVSRAMVRDLFDRDRSATVLANLTMAMVVAPMMAPAIGGVLIDQLGWRSVFAFVGAIGIVVAVLAFRRLPETQKARVPFAGITGMLAGFLRLLRSPMFSAYAFQAAFSLSAFFAFLAGAPYVMVDVLGRPATEYGLYFMLLPASFISGNFVTSRIAQRAGIDRMIMTGSLLALCGALLLTGLVAAGIWAPIAIFGASAFIAFSQGLSMASAQAGAMSVDPRLAGAASGLAGFLQMLTAGIVAQLVGMLQNGTPFPMAFAMLACAVLALLAFVLPRRLLAARALPT
jgi:MFS transporter, DHA1 family, multidrug resistance protein